MNLSWGHGGEWDGFLLMLLHGKMFIGWIANRPVGWYKMLCSRAGAVSQGATFPPLYSFSFLFFVFLSPHLKVNSVRRRRLGVTFLPLALHRIEENLNYLNALCLCLNLKPYDDNHCIANSYTHQCKNRKYLIYSLALLQYDRTVRW